MGNSVSSPGGKVIATKDLRSKSTKKSSAASASSTPDAPAASGRNNLAEEASITLQSGKTDPRNRDGNASHSEGTSVVLASSAVLAGPAVLAWGVSHLLNSLSNDASSTPNAPAASGRNNLAEEASVTLRSGKTDPRNRDGYASDSEGTSVVLACSAALAGAAVFAWGASHLLNSLSNDASSTPDAPAAYGRNNLAEEASVTLRSGKTDPRNRDGYASDSEEFPRRIRGIQMPQVITIVTYNIWQDDVKLKERMEAIGVLMQVKMPDIILLQEVTPEIHKIFKEFNWWQRYECVFHKTATTKHYCMLLSKFPVKDLGRVRIKDYIKKKLIVVEVEAQGKRRRLVVANGHLKKPDLPDESHTMKRKAQAHEAITILGDYENAIFGGDMNWSEELDGCFPLPDGWVDAWEHLRPRDKGWTLDTMSNRMITGRRRLQMRLDRFLCKLKDYELAYIKIIGKDIIPGLMHPYKDEEYPVLRSDHFGLLLGINI